MLVNVCVHVLCVVCTGQSTNWVIIPQDAIQMNKNPVELKLVVWLWAARMGVRNQTQILYKNRTAFQALSYLSRSLHLIGAFVLFCFWKGVSQWAWSQSNRLGWLASELQGFPVFTYPVLRLQALSTMLCFLVYLLGIKLKTPSLLGKDWLTKIASPSPFQKDFKTAVSYKWICSMDSMCVPINFSKAFK